MRFPIFYAQTNSKMEAEDLQDKDWRNDAKSNKILMVERTWRGEAGEGETANMAQNEQCQMHEYNKDTDERREVMHNIATRFTKLGATPERKVSLTNRR